MPLQRKHTAKGIVEDDGTPTLVFLNVCTANRKRWLADPHIHATLIKVWRSSTHWEVGPYVLMPDHLHLFAWPGFGSATFDRWVQYWKSMFTKRFATLICVGNPVASIIACVRGKERNRNGYT